MCPFPSQWKHPVCHPHPCLSQSCPCRPPRAAGSAILLLMDLVLDTGKLCSVAADLSKCFQGSASCKFLCTTATLRFSDTSSFRECSVQPALLLEHLKGKLQLVALKEDMVHDAKKHPAHRPGLGPSPSGTFLHDLNSLHQRTKAQASGRAVQTWRLPIVSSLQ